MLLFVPALPLCSTGLLRPSLLNSKGRATLCSSKTHRRPRTTISHASYTPPSSPSENDSNDDSMNWQEELRLLLDPTMSVSVKQVLIQDFAKRLPDALKSPCARGVEDIVRQLTEDVIPDLVTNGPRYVSRVVEQTTNSNPRQSQSFNSPPSSSFKAPSFDLDDVSREVRNVFNRTPEGLYTPKFKILVPLSKKGYEIRSYPTVIIAETNMNLESKINEGSKPTEVESATAMGQSFNVLAGYLFGKNASDTEMKMTTPVMLSKGEVNESMSFIIGEYSSLDDVPKTLDDTVKLREESGSIYAVIEFSGFVTVGEAKRQREKLLKMLESDGVKITEQGKDNHKCMIYNGPSTLPNLRRNELMIEVEYDLRDVESV